MAIYRERILPHLIDLACGAKDLQGWRTAVTAGLVGRVVEIGFGSGLNVRHYPSSVSEVEAVEPSLVARRLAAKRIARGGVPVQFVGLNGEKIPLEDNSCDSALSTFTLCTVAHPERALAEIRRVLRPDGQFHFLEHGLSPDTRVAKWQRRLDPLEVRIADGCHLTRDAESLVREAGFVLAEIDQHYARGPRPWTWFTCGVATNPAP